MLNDNQYLRLQRFIPVIRRVASGEGNTSNTEIFPLMNNIWKELGNKPVCGFCSQPIFELYNNIRDQIDLYESSHN